MGEVARVGLADGATVEALVSVPKAIGPGVLLLHDELGLGPHLRARCDELAEAGYVAMAPILREPSGDAVETAAHALFLHPRLGPRRVAVVGFARGGDHALRLATELPLHGLVVYSASLPFEDAPAVRAEVLGHLGGGDDVRARAAMTAFFAALGPRAAGFHTYEGAGRFFANADAPGGDLSAAALAWSRTRAFLHERLVGTRHSYPGAPWAR